MVLLTILLFLISRLFSFIHPCKIQNPNITIISVLGRYHTAQSLWLPAVASASSEEDPHFMFLSKVWYSTITVRACADTRLLQNFLSDNLHAMEVKWRGGGLWSNYNAMSRDLNQEQVALPFGILSIPPSLYYPPSTSADPQLLQMWPCWPILSLVT